MRWGEAQQAALPCIGTENFDYKKRSKWLESCRNCIYTSVRKCILLRCFALEHGWTDETGLQSIRHHAQSQLSSTGTFLNLFMLFKNACWRGLFPTCVTCFLWRSCGRDWVYPACGAALILLSSSFLRSLTENHSVTRCFSKKAATNIFLLDCIYKKNSESPLFQSCIIEHPPYCISGEMYHVWHCQKLIYHSADIPCCCTCFDIDVNGCVWGLEETWFRHTISERNRWIFPSRSWIKQKNIRYVITFHRHRHGVVGNSICTHDTGSVTQRK